MIASILIMASLWMQANSVDPCSTIECDFNADCRLNPETEEYGCVCPLEECFGNPLNPMCGSDNKTYSNSCEMVMASCRIQSHIYFKHAGKCGQVQCLSDKQCRNHAICTKGICQCPSCQRSLFDSHRRLFGSRLSINTPVCGTDWKTYSSECVMKQQSCRKRTRIFVRKYGSCVESRPISLRGSEFNINHLQRWIYLIEPRRNNNGFTSNTTDDNEIIKSDNSQETCNEVKLEGCVPKTFLRKEYLGIYHKTNLMLHHAPVYKLLGRHRNHVYLSRYMSKEKKASWIVGSRVNSGTGWIGSRDSATDPSKITQTWSATTGNRKKIWRTEPTLKTQCINPYVPEEKPVCIPGHQSGTYTENSFRIQPIYKMNVFHNVYRGKYYKPNRKFKVRLFTSMSKHRMSAVYMHMTNSDGNCITPVLAKGKRRYSVLCNGSLIKRTSAKGLRKLTMTLKAPTRGCITLRFFIKAKNDQVFYDKDISHSRHPFLLTRIICDDFPLRLRKEKALGKTKKKNKPKHTTSSLSNTSLNTTT